MAVLTLFRRARNSEPECPESPGYVVIGHALIPDHLAVHPAIASHRWSYYKSPNKRTGYARRYGRSTNRRTISIYLHRTIYEILHGPIPPDKTVDHIDGDGLNNDATNLRLATRSQQQANRRVRRTTSTAFRGVHFKKPEHNRSVRPNPWQAKIVPPGEKQIYLGYFPCAVDAAYAYNVAATITQGEFAVPNDIPAGALTAIRMVEIESKVLDKLRAHVPQLVQASTY